MSLSSGTRGRCMSLLWSPKKVEAARARWAELPSQRWGTGARLNRRFAFVLNQTPPRGCRLSEAATSLHSLGVLALPFVGQRNDHQDALGAGLGVTEFAPEGKASEEIRELWRWVLKKLIEGSLDYEQNANKAAS